MERFLLPCLAIIAWVTLQAASAVAEVGPEASQAAERLVFLLQYVGTDYAAAVKGGAVVDEDEYREMREFSIAIVEDYGKIRRFVPSDKAGSLSAAFDTLRKLIETRAEANEVRAATESAIPVLIEAFALRPMPKRVPMPERAGALYAENCSSCHGVEGRGNGPRAKELDPPPADFTDPARVEPVAPYVFYNAITFGIPNTGMPSFGESLTDEQRWDLAFYLWTFSVPQPAGGPAVTLSLRDLATRPSTELAADVVRQAARAGVTIGEAEAKAIVGDRRARPQVLSDHEERIARVRQDLLQSLSRLAAGDLQGAADRMTMSYLNDFEPLEPQIDRLDPSARRKFERDLLDFFAALRRDDRDSAATIGRSLAVTVDRIEGILGRNQPRTSRTFFFSLLAVVLVAGVFLIALRGAFSAPTDRGVGKRRIGR